MGRIKNKQLYNIDTNLSLDDYIIGSDFDSDGKTKNYPVRSIVTLLNNAVVQVVGNEPEEGVGEGFDSIAEGKPIVAERGKLIFEVPEDNTDVVMIKVVSSFTSFSGLLSQVGTSNPTAIELDNDLGTTLGFTYNDVGTFDITSEESLFTPQTILIQGAGNKSNTVILRGQYISTTVFRVYAYDIGNVGETATYQNVEDSLANGVLDEQFIELRVTQFNN